VSTQKVALRKTPPASNNPRSEASAAPLPASSSRKVNKVAQTAEHGWLFRNKRFQSMCNAVFEAVDTDGSGSIDEKELYAGLLLIHLKLGAYAGPAACRPLGRDRCQKVFEDMDTDNSGSLDQEEFRLVMIYLFGNVLIRVLVQWGMTLLIVPLVAQYILDGIYWMIDAVYDFITTLDEDYVFADNIELLIESIWTKFVTLLPDFVVSKALLCASLLDKVPDAVWNSIPLTLLSTILGIAVVPYIIFSIDELFTNAAKAKRTKISKDSQNKGA
jgi:hypothetical protein